MNRIISFPKVTTKNGHKATNSQFPALYRDCAISGLGRGAYFQYKGVLF